MNDKQKPHIGVSASNGLIALLCDTKVTTDILKAAPSLEKVCQQIQRDVMAGAKDDREDGWQQIVGLELVLEQILLFKKEGEADLKSEQDSVKPQPEGDSQ